MAFKKSIPTDFGVDALYWRIVGCQHDLLSGNGTIYMAGYLNEEVRRANKKPMSTGSIPYEDGEFGMDEPRSAIYAKLRAKGAPWDTAEDA